jgi:hypothetical protein
MKKVFILLLMVSLTFLACSDKEESASKLYHKALTLQQVGKDDEAYIIFQDIIRKYPETKIAVKLIKKTKEALASKEETERVKTEIDPEETSGSKKEKEGSLQQKKEGFTPGGANATRTFSEPRRAEAVASLHAVRSALSAGANLQEFKKYQIESRIKIDALPSLPENLDIKEASDLYNEAVTFGIMRITGTVNSGELEVAREKFRNHAFIMKCLNGMQPNYDSRGFIHDLNQINAEAISKSLLILADEKISALK